jgi:DNA-binding NarL/FixJ family response regulator
MTNRPRLLLADDHKLVLEGFRRILQPEFEIIGEVEDGRSLLEAAQRLHPEVVLLDISMPLLNGIDAARQLHKICPETKLIILTMHSDQRYVIEAFQAGASGFLLKRSRPRELVDAIWAVARGEQYVAPEFGIEAAAVFKKADRETRSKGPGLSPRQREVLQLVAEGKQSKEIASLLDISLKAVEFHRSAIAHKLGTKNKSELTRYAINCGLVAGGVTRK